MKRIVFLLAISLNVYLLKAQENTNLGTNAGNAGTSNVSIGYSAGDVVTGSSNTFVGYNSGAKTTSPSGNSFFGMNSGYTNITGVSNSFFGFGAGYYNTSNNNTFIGYNSGNKNSSGTGNAFLGHTSGYNTTTGTNNVFLGYQSGYYNTTGSQNTFLGINSGFNNTTGNNNTNLGFYSGFTNSTGSNNVFIGNYAGYAETGSNKLYIDNSTTTTPLIYGDFTNDNLNINGKLGIGNNATPFSKLCVTGTIDNYNWSIGNGWGDFSITNGTYGLAAGVACGGGGAGDVAIWAKGGTQRLIFGNPINGVTMNIVNGNVGIGSGAYTPQGKLDVRGDVYINSGDDDINHIYWDNHFMIMGTKPGDYSHNILRLQPGGSSQGALFSAIEMYTANSETSFSRNILITSNGDSYLNAGNVGIGTVNPVSKLSIGENHGVILSIGNPNWNNKSILETGLTSSVDYTDLKVPGYSTNTAALRLLANGNVLIGKTTQTNSNYKLDVDGTIRANEIIVNTTGADFVFENQYKLRSLTEIENFVKQNKHLPEIAPAKEMQENGVSVNELQVKLLQKVEELTLYMIEQNKNTEELQKQIQKLAKENEILKAEISKLK